MAYHIDRTEPRWHSLWLQIRPVVLWALLPIAVLLLLHQFVMRPYLVEGTSMAPTLEQGNRVLVLTLGRELSHLRHPNATYLPNRGQLVVFHYPKAPARLFIKRVIGLPGDRVVISGKGWLNVYTAGHHDAVFADYRYHISEDQTRKTPQSEIIKSGRIFVLGDNRHDGGSYDSRMMGQLSTDYLVGNVPIRIWPLGELRLF